MNSLLVAWGTSRHCPSFSCHGVDHAVLLLPLCTHKKSIPKLAFQFLLAVKNWNSLGQSAAVTRSHARLAASQDHMALLVGSSDVALLWAAPHLYPGPRSFSILRCCSCQGMLGQASCLMSVLVQGVRFWTRSLWGHVPTATKRPVESLQWLSGPDPPFVTPNSAVGKQSWSGSTWEAKHESADSMLFLLPSQERIPGEERKRKHSNIVTQRCAN